MTITIQRTWKVDGVLTNVTSAKLSDPTGTYGIKRNDTDAVVIADGTVLTNTGTGVYAYQFSEPDTSIAYTAYVEIVYDGATHHFEVDIPAQSSGDGMSLEYDDFRAEIGDYLGWTRTPANWSSIESSRILSVIKSGLLRVYYPEKVRPEFAHHWSWMSPETEIELDGAYSTGTVEVSSGVVTLTDGTFPSWAEHGELTVNGSTYNVSSRDSDTQITLDDTTVDVDAGGNYSLGRYSYELPSDFSGVFDGDLNYKAGTNSLYDPILIVADQNIRRMRQRDHTCGRPTHASLRPASFSATTGQRWEITFYPSPNGDYTLSGRYKVSPTMIDSENKYPMGGPAMSELFLESCLAVAEERFRTEQSQGHQERFLALLASAIDIDADAFSADTIGYNGDNSDGPNTSWRDPRRDGALHSYEGVYYYD